MVFGLKIDQINSLCVRLSGRTYIMTEKLFYKKSACLKVDSCSCYPHCISKYHV